MLVRFKADACLPTKPAKEIQKSLSDPLDDLTAGLQKLTVAKSSDTTTKIPTFNGVSLSVITRGTLVPQSALLELKTRSQQSVGHLDWDDTYPQLLLSQTPNVFVCVHKFGTFQEVRKKRLDELETEAVARKAQEGLRKLRNVLGRIQETVTEEGEGARLSLVCKGGADMIVYERGGKDGCLPEEILKKFKE